MTWLEFSARLGLALLLGGTVGLERQWRQRGAGLRTNALVSTGAAMFVMLSVMTPGDSSPTRVAAQVVSGIGFLGGGVIFREGISVRGLDTAATLWCAAALGCLTGAGFVFQAFIGSLAILVSNILLRPVANKINRESAKTIKQSSNQWEVAEEPRLNIDQALRLDPEFAAAYNSYKKKGWFRDRFSSRPSAIENLKRSIVDSFQHDKETEEYFKQRDAQSPGPNPIRNTRQNRSSYAQNNSIDSSRRNGKSDPRRMSDANPKLELANAYFNLGSTRVQLDDKQGATADLQKAAKLFLALSDKTRYQETVDLLRKINP
jgi:uncharacterized membrane protein YhiD involved in acid resistance